MRPQPRRLSITLGALCLLPLRCLGADALPPAESLLPPDTIAYLTIPDTQHARSQWVGQAVMRAWYTPSLEGFRRHLQEQYVARLEQPFAALTGIEIRQALRLAEGQLTLGIVPPDTGPGDPTPGVAHVLILDAGSQAAGLDDVLRRADTHAPAPRATIGGVEFLVRQVPRDRLRALWEDAFPLPDDPPQGRAKAPSAPPLSLYLGRAGTVLLAATSSNALSRAVERLNAATLAKSLPPAGEPQAGPSPAPILKARVFGPALQRHLGQERSRTLGQSGLTTGRVLDALGLPQLQSASAEVHANPEGWYLHLGLEVPPAGRRGVFRFLQVLESDTSPPDFIGADAVSFRRARLGGKAAWTSLEALLRDLDPSFLGVLQLFAGYAGRTDDVDFDFQKGVIDLLGNDWITASYPAPEGTGREETILLVGSPKARELLHGLRLIGSPTYLATFLPPDSPAPQRLDREVQGHPVVTITMPPMPWWGGRTGVVHLATRDGWVALTSSDRQLNRFLSGPAEHALRAQPGVGAAAAAVGISEGGYFAFRDERALARRLFTAFKDRPDLLEDTLRWAALSETATRLVTGLTEWVDFTRLPAFSEVAPFFGHCVQSGRVTPSGFSLWTFRPEPIPPPTP